MKSGTTCRVEVQTDIIDKKLKFYVINAYEVAEKTGMGGRVNTIMQTAFFAISGVLPREQAIAEIKHAIEKTYGKRGEAVVKQNFEAVDQHPRQPVRGQGPRRRSPPRSRGAIGSRTSAGLRPQRPRRR